MKITGVSPKIILGIFVLALCLRASAAHAQKDDRYFGFRPDVRDGYKEAYRDPFDYRGEPLRMDGFLLWPNLSFEALATDNIYADEKKRDGDIGLIVSPRLTLQKNIGRHEFGFDGFVETRKFLAHGGEDVTNAHADFNARLEAWHDLRIPLAFIYDSGHEEREDRRDPGSPTRSPVGFSKSEIFSGLEWQPNRLKLELLGSYQVKRFEDGVLFSGGPAIRRDRDFNAPEGEARVTYETGTGWKPYASFTRRNENYLRGLYTGAGFDGPSRDNALTRLRGGLSFDFHGLAYGFFEAGRETRHYAQAGAGDISAFSARGNVTLEPLRKLRVSLEAARETEEDNELVAAVDKTGGALHLDYELRHDLFLRLDGAYALEDFPSETRHDTVMQDGVSLRFIVNPHLQLGARYLYQNRDSSLGGVSFGSNGLTLNVTAAL